MSLVPFENALVQALQPVRFHALALALYQLFESGLFAYLEQHPATRLGHISEALQLDRERLEAYVYYLRNEGYLTVLADEVQLSPQALGLKPFRPWYTMMVGGYTPTWLGLSSALKRGAPPSPRDLRQVGVGSCGISHFDAIPLTRRLMALAPAPCTRLLDMGCGNGLYLVEFCKAMPEVEQAWGVEPSAASCREANALILAEGLHSRITILNLSAREALDHSAFRSDDAFSPNFVVLGFVLHEILGQDGREGVLHFLSSLVERFPDLNLIVIEVDNHLHDPEKMGDGLGQAYYNPYSMLHPFTLQRLESPAFWQALFHEAGLEILAQASTDPQVDSTGLEHGYLLRRTVRG